MLRLLSGDAGARGNVAGGRVRHIRELNRQIAELTSQISAPVAASGTTLTDIHGIGALTAADDLAEIGDPRRFATKAKFAMANGGDNRQLNGAIHTAVITQIASSHSEGRQLYEHHLNRGKTKREAIRALKRRISDRARTHLQRHPTEPHLTWSLTQKLK